MWSLRFLQLSSMSAQEFLLSLLSKKTLRFQFVVCRFSAADRKIQAHQISKERFEPIVSFRLCCLQKYYHTKTPPELVMIYWQVYAFK